MCRMNCREGFLWAPCKAPDVGGVMEFPDGSLQPYVPSQWGWHPCPECNKARHGGQEVTDTLASHSVLVGPYGSTDGTDALG